MSKKRYLQAGILVLLLMLVAQTGWHSLEQPSAPASSAAPRMAGVSGTLPGGEAGAAAQAPFEVVRDVKHDVSPALRNIKPAPAAQWTTPREMPERDQPGAAPAPQVNDPVVQSSLSSGSLAPLASAPSTIQNFDGNPNVDGYYPPDTNGDVGPNNYVQTTNVRMQIFSKTGVPFYSTPILTKQLWAGFGGPCETRNDGDPIVLYDSLADRWNISQFTSASPYGQCIAISTTPDPTGTYYRYFFQFSLTTFYDYPHLGVWPDGYYMGANRFTQIYQGASAIVFDRAKMLQGLPATYQAFNLSTSYGTLLPSDLDGSNPPPAGSPNYFASRGTSSLNIWKFHVDWANSANSTFTGPTSLPVAAYNQLCSNTRSCIPQPGTSVGLDGLGDRLMHRLAYRHFSDHESLVVSHNVNAASSGLLAGVRWYELRISNQTPSVYQQGTYAPDTTNRWLGSVAMDGSGNMAMGYSVASSSVYAGLSYTGRLATDALGTMPQGETALIAGSGSQTGTANRWGDYAMMAVDPLDDCTFWFTSEYMPTTGGAPWHTRISSFKFPSCGSATAPTATPTTVTGATNTPAPTSTSTPVPPTATPVPAAPDFSLSASPASAAVSRSGPPPATYTVNLASLNGYSGTVNLSVSGLPSKTSATFNPSSVALTAGGTGTSTLTISSTSSKGPTGTYTLTITGSDGTTSHSQTVTLTVNK